MTDSEEKTKSRAESFDAPTAEKLQSMRGTITENQRNFRRKSDNLRYYFTINLTYLLKAVHRD